MLSAQQGFATSSARGIFLVCLAAALVSTGRAAVTITQWNFNSAPPDVSTTTGSLAPSVGTGTAVVVLATSAFADGSGSSDPASTDDTGWNLDGGFASQGTGNQTRGAQWMVNTTGYGAISLIFDQRNSNTASRFWSVHYTLDGGSSWVPFFVTGGNTSAGLFEISAAATWFNGLAVDFSSVAGAANNALFGVRVLSSFAPSTSAYSPTNGSFNYLTTGTARFDMVTFSGVVIPEPGRVTLLLAAGMALALRRRRC